MRRRGCGTGWRSTGVPSTAPPATATMSANRARERARRQLGIGAALEAIARVGHEAERAAHPAHARRVEVRDLEEDVGRGVRHFAVAPAHDAGEALRALGVRDHAS